ncbi:HPr family phosphocarrier protein [Aeromicrobium sp. CTD01-1L150]|uniref:HPr family phosphocarrier protein n=1 Tax=Aeromicrobium sp. CTD01-1L150 TaxID=3341830 RepID=UPI0035BF4FBC
MSIDVPHERRARVASRAGLHARPATRLASAAAEQPVRVGIRRGDGPTVDASSVLGLMTLGASHGDEVVLTAEGDRAADVLDAMVALVERELDDQ